MPYDHSKPEIAAAYKAYQDIVEQNPGWIKMSDHPDYLEAYVNYLRTLEEDGQIYAQTVEIIFPPQLTKQCKFGAISIPTGRVLKWLANDLESIGEHEQTKLYREVVMPFYPDPDDDNEEEDEDYEIDDDDDSEDDPFVGLEEIFPLLNFKPADSTGEA